MDGAEIDFRANNGDVRAQAAEELSGRALGEVLGSMCNMLDPAAIILRVPWRVWSVLAQRPACSLRVGQCRLSNRHPS